MEVLGLNEVFPIKGISFGSVFFKNCGLKIYNKKKVRFQIVSNRVIF
jgi:hypothetical protein